MDSRMTLHRFGAVRAFMLAGLLSIFAGVSLAQPGPDEVELLPEPVSPLPLHYFSLPLGKLTGDDRPARLDGVKDSLSVSLPLSAMWDPVSVRLRLQGVASIVLNEFSQLVVSVNGRVVDQLSLSTVDGVLSREIELPVALLEPGFNTVELAVAQHYTDYCEYPLAPQLWSQIDMQSSGFEIAALPAPVAPQLDQLSTLFDRTDWVAEPVVQLFSISRPGSAGLKTLGLVAQGVAQRFDYVPVQILKTSIPESRDALRRVVYEESRTAILVGTFDQIGHLLDPTVPTSGPVIAVQAFDDEMPRNLVVVAGRDAMELEEAAEAFAVLRMPWPAVSSALVRSVDIPGATTLEQRFAIPTAETGAFPLRALGFQTTTFRGMQAGSAVLQLWNNTWQGRAQVRAHVAYGAGMSINSSLAVLVNGVVHAQIPLNDPRGALYENYAVTLPAGALDPGWNSLEFRPQLMPGVQGGECEPMFVDHLAVTLYEDTTIQKFGGNQYQSTDLSLVSGRGLLFSRYPLGANIGFQLTGDDDDTLTAALTLIGKLSQVYDRPLLNSWIGMDAPPTAEDIYLIGVIDQLPLEYRQRTRLAIPEYVRVAAPLIQSATVQVIEGWDWMRDLLDWLGFNSTPPANTTAAELAFDGTIAGAGFALSTRNDAGDPVIIITAANATDLRDSVTALIDFGMWAQLRGMFAWWVAGEERVVAVTAEDAPFSAYGLRGGIGLWVSQRPWTSLLLVSGLVAVLVALSAVLSMRRRRRQQALEE